MVNSLQELSGKTVIVQKGGIAHDDLLQSGLAVNLVLRENAAETLRLLASGEGDYAVVAMVPAEFLVRELGLTNIVPVARRIQSREYCYAVKKGNSELLARFAEGLAILQKTGQVSGNPSQVAGGARSARSSLGRHRQVRCRHYGAPPAVAGRGGRLVPYSA